jgi:stearoyl-CoA desaturase (Delta-9 desaturase)
MSATRRLANLAGTVLPLIGFGFAIALLWHRMVGPRELTILFVGYAIAGLGITVGYHRLFTHRSFQTTRAVRYVFAVCGQCAVQGNVVSWVANHRKHHQYSDRSGDPHSPHAGRGDGFIEGAKGLWHAHTGWLFDSDATADRNRYAPDLIDDRGLRIIAALFVPTVLVSILLPGLVGWLWIGGRYGFLADRLGRSGPHPPAPPRDMVDQLDLPLRRQETLHDLRPVTERVVAVLALIRRVLAQQPPRIPHFCLPRSSTS